MNRILLIIFLTMLTAGCATMRPTVLNRAFHEEVEATRQLMASGHLKQAVEELTLLIDMDPKNVEARTLRGVAYQQLEEFGLAIKDFEAVIQTDPSSSKAYYNLGMIFAYKLYDLPKALEYFDRFLSLAPDHNRAFSVAKIMRSLDASRGASSNVLPDLLKEAEGVADLGERRRRLSEISKLDPASPLPDYSMGQCYEAEGKESEAIKSYQEALHKGPTCAPCHESLGRLLIRKKRESEGRIHLTKARLFDPNDSQTPQDF